MVSQFETARSILGPLWPARRCFCVKKRGAGRRQTPSAVVLRLIRDPKSAPAALRDVCIDFRSFSIRLFSPTSNLQLLRSRPLLWCSRRMETKLWYLSFCQGFSILNSHHNILRTSVWPGRQDIIHYWAAALWNGAAVWVRSFMCSPAATVGGSRSLLDAAVVGSWSGKPSPHLQK